MPQIATPPAGAVKISGPSGLAGLTEKDIWRDPNSKDIYRLAAAPATAPPAGATKIAGPSGLAGLTEQQIWRQPGSIDIYKLPEKPPENASQVGDLDQARTYINQQQDTDIAAAAKGEEPPVRGVSDVADELKTEVTGGAAKPGVPKYEETFTGLRAQYGISDLEGKLNEVNAREAATAAKYRERMVDEEGKPVAMNVISGRQSEWEKMAERELDAIRREKNTIVNELNTKYSVVENLMKFKQMDYSAASDDYDKTFSQNLSLINAARGMREEQKTEKERQQDNARANLQIIQNNLASGAVKELTPEQTALVRKLEVQAGLPLGFTESFRNKNPKGEIITTKSWQGTDGTEYVSVITKDENGKLITENIKVGTGRLPTGTTPQPTDADVLLYYKNSMVGQMKAVVGDDGYLSPEDWRTARKSWTDRTPYSGKDFDDNFRSYVNPKHPQDYEGFEEYSEGFRKF